MVAHDLRINAQYKRSLEGDMDDIEDLAKEAGGVLNSKTSEPIAFSKDGDGGVHKFSALCPDMKGVVCWNKSENSWACPVRGSRFSKDGLQVMGPAKENLPLVDETGKATQQQAVEA